MNIKFIFCLILTLLVLPRGYSQEFSFELYFEDALGNRDTVLLGYDVFASDIIDIPFNEVDIIGQPWNSNLDVRITNEWSNRFFQNIPGTQHSKIQIIEKLCLTNFTTIGIDIRTNNWPVTASWDSSSFNTSCLNGSVLTSQIPGTWWDVMSPSDLLRVPLNSSNSISFSSNNDIQSDYSFVSNGDSISHFFVQFSDSTLLTASINEFDLNEKIILYPNPSSEFLSIEFKMLQPDTKVEILNLNGRHLFEKKITTKITTIDVSTFSKGIYIVQVSKHNEIQEVRKLVIH